jgi:DHA1 family bicyclomycin/chloramphenicol resistance-like MFS transporter
MVIARAVVRDLFDDRQAARVFSSLVLVMGLAPILAPLLGGWLGGHVGWRAVFWVLAGAGVLTLISTALFFRESLPVERRLRHSAGETVRTYLFLLRDRQFMLHALTIGVGLAGLFAYVGGSPYVFQKVFAIDEAHFGFYFGPIAAGIIGMSQVNGLLAGRATADIRKLLRTGLCVGALAGVVLLADALSGFGGFWGIYVPLWVVIASFGFVFPNTTVLAMSPHGRIAGAASAVLGCVQFGVSAIGGVVVSAIQNAQAKPTPVPMAAAIAACTAAALGLNLLTRPRPCTPKPCDEAEGELVAAEV